jgi:hypothetical protein
MSKLLVSDAMTKVQTPVSSLYLCEFSMTYQIFYLKKIIKENNCLSTKVVLIIIQSLLSSMVIGAELCREDHCSIPRSWDRKGTETT